MSRSRPPCPIAPATATAAATSLPARRLHVYKWLSPSYASQAELLRGVCSYVQRVKNHKLIASDISDRLRVFQAMVDCQTSKTSRQCIARVHLFQTRPPVGAHARCGCVLHHGINGWTQ